MISALRILDNWLTVERLILIYISVLEKEQEEEELLHTPYLDLNRNRRVSWYITLSVSESQLLL